MGTKSPENLPRKAEPGLTFISSVFGDTNEMRLVRLDGPIVHRSGR
jgi:hypothetical protein